MPTPFPAEVRKFVESTRWTFAKTYAATWPHEYVVENSENAEMIVALARHIVEHGTEGRFYSQIRKYHHEGGKVYWSMDDTPEETELINRCDEAQTYDARLAAGTLPGKQRVPADTARLLSAIEFASRKHSTQRRRDEEASPYINHPIAVTHLLADTGGITDLVTLMAAVLHDTIEDTETTASELDQPFGQAVRKVVEEVTDNKALDKAVRKQLQIEHAPHLSRHAKAIKLADKIANVRDVTESPPPDWSVARRIEYLDWTEKVVAGCRGTNDALEKLYDEVLLKGRAKFGA